MGCAATIRRAVTGNRFLKDKCGQSLIEIALMMPVLILLMSYAIDFSYFFIAAANITSAARNGAQYSVLGYEGPAQTTEPVAGPTTTSTSVAALVMSDMTSLLGSSTTTAVRVCSKVIGVTANVAQCSNYGVTGTAYTPATDPEAPRFVLQRVDVTYTVQPPIPMSVFGHSLLPSLSFHRQVSMRSMD
jgi:Flp pilus assembly protein TadG